MADQPSLVVAAQTFYPCWKASVDGQPARLWRANYAFQAVQVPDFAELTSRKAHPYLYREAQVAELVDALVSGTSAERRGGSSPLLGTTGCR